MSKRILKFIPTILWMCFIFYLSSQQTTGIPGTYNQRFAILKSFHLIEYTVLYILNFFAFHKPLPSFGLSYLFAASDEYHQTFIPGRTGQFRDTLIDLLGMCIGYALLWVISHTRFYKKLFA